MADSIITTLRLIGQRSYVSGMDAAARSTSRLERRANSAGTSMNVFQSKMGGVRGIMGVVSSGMKGLALGIGAVTFAVGKMGIEYNAQMEQATIGIGTLVDDTKKGARIVGKATQIGLNEPLVGVNDALQTTQQLIGAGFSSKKATKSLTAFSDVLSAMGRDPQDIKRLTYAFSQMMTKGQISSEELKGQLGEIFPASRILADELHMTGSQLAAAMKEGSVRGKKPIYALIDGIEKKWGDASKRQSGTWNGMWANLKENIKFTSGLITKDLFDKLKPVLGRAQKIAKQIQGWAKGGGVKRAVGTLKTAFKAGSSDVTTTGPVDKVMAAVGGFAGKVFPVVIKYVKQFFDALKPALPFVENVLWPLIKGFGKGLLGGIVALIPLIKIVAQVLGWIGEKARPVRGIIEGIGMVIGFVFGPSKIGIFKIFGRMFAFIGSKVGVLWKWLGRVSDIVAWVSLRFGAAGRAIARFVTNGISKIRGMPGRVISVGGDIVKAIIKGISGLGRAIGAVISDAVGAVTAAAVSLGAAIWDGIKSGIMSVVPDKVKSVISGALGLSSGPKNKNQGPGAAAAGRPGRRRAHGGLASGSTLVGENGPELMHVPGPGMISPIKNLGGSMSSAVSFSVVAPIYLNQRQIGQAVFNEASDRMARK
jgi:tape measure domain-containing protein